MNVFSRTGALVGIAAVALAVAGCGGDTSMSDMSMTTSTSAASTSSAASSSSAVSTSSSVATAPAAPATQTGVEVSAEHNNADVMFAQMMIEHHRGAIEMAQLAPDRAASQEVKDLAAKIEAAQAPEIELMTSWLEAWDTAMMSMGTGGMDMGTGGMDMGTGGMDMGGGMAGMMTPEQMIALEAASGAAFDTMFLELMIVHHQGALQMSETEIAQGSNPEALALAESIKTSQTSEIAEMQELLQGM